MSYPFVYADDLGKIQAAVNNAMAAEGLPVRQWQIATINNAADEMSDVSQTCQIPDSMDPHGLVVGCQIGPFNNFVCIWFEDCSGDWMMMGWDFKEIATTGDPEFGEKLRAYVHNILG